MMNIQNLGSQESIGVKYIDSICAKFCLKATGVFILLSQDGFKYDQETKFQTIFS